MTDKDIVEKLKELNTTISNLLSDIKDIGEINYEIIDFVDKDLSKMNHLIQYLKMESK